MCWTCWIIRPSVHLGGGGGYPSCLQARGRQGEPWVSSSQGQHAQTNNMSHLSFTPKTLFKCPHTFEISNNAGKLEFQRGKPRLQITRRQRGSWGSFSGTSGIFREHFCARVSNVKGTRNSLVRYSSVLSSESIKCTRVI